MLSKASLAFILSAISIIGGCAFNVVHVQQIPTRMDLAGPCAASFFLTEDLTVSPSGGFERKLKKQTHWDCVGQIPQGQVYRTRDQVLTIEASHVYEANLVVSFGRLVGFYLPVERTFSPLDSPVVLPVD